MPRDFRIPRDFTDVQRELQECATSLAEFKDPKELRAILADMRVLLKEAESILRRVA